MKQQNSWLVVAAMGAFCLFVNASQAHAAKHKKKHKAQVAQSSDAPASQSQSSGDTYVNVGKVGFGPSMDSALVPLTTEGGESVQWGTLDGRYWVNNKFGFDGGYGLGFPQISPKSSTLISLRAEGMMALKETRQNIFYADAEILPMFTSGSGSSTSFWGIQGGVGLEHAVKDMPVSFYTEWEPLSIDIYSAGGGASTNTSLGILGGIMNFTIGLRYYF